MSAAIGRVLTPRAPGAVAIVEVEGDVAALCDVMALPRLEPGEVRLADVPGVDELLVARLDGTRVHLMPHGGLRIVELLVERLHRAGVMMDSSMPTVDDPVMRAVLEAVPSARTPLALDCVLAQWSRWRRFSDAWTAEDDARSARLNRLLEPPLVVLAGRPNIGKSTLLNTLAGRPRAVTHDAPGTTRDHVGVELDLGGLVVHWVDLPGLHSDAEGPEAQAIVHAGAVMRQADLLIATRDATSDWPSLDRVPDLRIGLRSDLGVIDDALPTCCAHTGEGVGALVSLVGEALVPEVDRVSCRPWCLPGMAVPV